MKRSRMRRVNPERKAKRYERDFGALAEFVRSLDCCACDTSAPSDPAHVKSRGAGGHAFLDSGKGNIIPLCRRCHNLQHSRGWGAVPWSSPSGPIAHTAGESRETAEGFAEMFAEAFVVFGGKKH